MVHIRYYTLFQSSWTFMQHGKYGVKNIGADGWRVREQSGRKIQI